MVIVFINGSMWCDVDDDLTWTQNEINAAKSQIPTALWTKNLEIVKNVDGWLDVNMKYVTRHIPM